MEKRITIDKEYLIKEFSVTNKDLQDRILNKVSKINFETDLEAFEWIENFLLKEQDINNKANKVVEMVTDHLNSFSDERAESFIRMMAKQHRTLQQGFTRLCLKWLEHISKDEYLTDPRNEDSKKIAKEMIDAFKKEKGQNYDPSQYLGHV